MFEASPAPLEPGVVERGRLAQSSARASSSSILHSASGWVTPWCAPIGTDQTVRSRAYCAARVERQPAGADAQRGGHDPLRVEAVEQRAQPRLGADSRSSPTSTSSKNSCHCLSAPAARSGSRCATRPGASTSTMNSERQPEAVPSASRVRATTSSASASSTPRDEHLLAADPVAAVAVGRRARGDVVRVRAGVGLGDRERDLRRARRDAAQPAVLLLLGAVAREDRARDRRRDDEQQQRAARGRELLADRGQLGHPAPAAAVLLGDVHAEVALLARARPTARWAAGPRRASRGCTSGRTSPRSPPRSRAAAAPRRTGSAGSTARRRNPSGEHMLAAVRAIQMQEFGGPEVLQLVDIPVPEPAEGEVLIKVAPRGAQLRRHPPAHEQLPGEGDAAARPGLGGRGRARGHRRAGGGAVRQRRLRRVRHRARWRSRSRSPTASTTPPPWRCCCRG